MSMVTAGRIVDNVLQAMHMLSNDAERKRVWRILNNEYFDIASLVSWESLRQPRLTISFAGATSSGVRLPSNLVGIDSIQDHDTGEEYFARDQADVDPDEVCLRYYTEKDDAALYDGSDLSITQSASSFVSPLLEAYLTANPTVTLVGEYIRFGGEPGLYKITTNTSPFGISTSYKGPSLEKDTFTIRPAWFTKRLILIDENKDLVQTGSVDVYYWALPPALYHQNDVVYLPASNYLELRTLRQIPEAKALRPVSFDEVEEAKYLAFKLNPTFRRKMHPRGKQGGLMAFKRNPFQARS